MRSLVVVLLLSFVAPVGAQRKETRYQVPAGTALLLTLRTPLDSRTAVVFDQVEATLWSPVVQDGVVLIPEGSVAYGSVVDVKRASVRSPLGSVAVEFSIVEHNETQSRATMTTRKVVVEAPAPAPGVKGKLKLKPVDATLATGARFVAVTTEPLIVRIPK